MLPCMMVTMPMPRAQRPKTMVVIVSEEDEEAVVMSEED